MNQEVLEYRMGDLADEFKLLRSLSDKQVEMLSELRSQTHDIHLFNQRTDERLKSQQGHIDSIMAKQTKLETTIKRIGIAVFGLAMLILGMVSTENKVAAGLIKKLLEVLI